MKDKVIILVKNGTAEAVSYPDNVIVEIRDYDNVENAGIENCKSDMAGTPYVEDIYNG